MTIMAGIPGGRHLALGSYSEDPAIRDFRIVSHLAMYSGVSKGAFGDLPWEPSASGAEALGFGGGPFAWSAGGMAPPPPPPRPIGLNPPEKTGGEAVPVCALSAGAVQLHRLSRTAPLSIDTQFLPMVFAFIPSLGRWWINHLILRRHVGQNAAVTFSNARHQTRLRTVLSGAV